MLLGLLLVTPLATPVRAEHANNPVIFDTDLSSDVDDAGAVAVLHALANQGKIQILAMMVSSGDPWSGPCLDVLNTSFGRPDIPIGIIGENAVTHVSKYTRPLSEHYPHDLSAPRATQLYRKILAGQSAGTVTVVSVGYFSNLSALLESRPDEFSSLDGKTLVNEKVKRLISMGGGFPKGREWNIYQDARSAANVASHWPTPIIFCGFEIGNTIMTGKILQQVPAKHPLREAYQLYNNLTNRQSWDQTTVLLAADLDGVAQGTYLDLSGPGRVQIDQNGNNTWEPIQQGNHRYVLSNSKTKDLAGIIDELMLSAALGKAQ